MTGDEIWAEVNASGFALISDPELVSDALDVARRFYDLNISERLQLRCTTSFVGYTPSETEVDASISIQTGLRPRGYASFDFGGPEISGEPLLFPDNILPADRKLAQDIIMLHKRLRLRAAPLVSAFASTFTVRDLDVDTLHSSARLLQYAPSSLGLSKEHADFELFAMILTDGPGLELLTNGGWSSPVMAFERELIILPGECSRLVSEHGPSAVRHRVRLDRNRLSVPYFQGLGADTLVGSSSVTYRDHMVSHYRKSYANIRP